MFPNINPKQMEQAMKKLGIKQEEIDAYEVLIRTPEKDIVVLDPSVVLVNMGGQQSFQISGKVEERPREVEIKEEDIKTVMDQTGASHEKALHKIKECNGDLAEAIVRLS